MVATMKNFEVEENLNSLIAFQNMEKSIFEKTGEHLLKGRVKISYAINKNIIELKKALQAYVDTRKEVDDEYRDTKEEQKQIQAENELAKKENRRANDVQMVFKDIEKKDEYIKKVNELREVETEVNVHAVNVELFDGIELNSCDMRYLMFMIED